MVLTFIPEVFTAGNCFWTCTVKPVKTHGRMEKLLLKPTQCYASRDEQQTLELDDEGLAARYQASCGDKDDAALMKRVLEHEDVVMALEALPEGVTVEVNAWNFGATGHLKMYDGFYPMDLRGMESWFTKLQRVADALTMLCARLRPIVEMQLDGVAYVGRRLAKRQTTSPPSAWASTGRFPRTRVSAQDRRAFRAAVGPL